jgi:hypothetical protein
MKRCRFPRKQLLKLKIENQNKINDMQNNNYNNWKTTCNRFVVYLDLMGSDINF